MSQTQTQSYRLMFNGTNKTTQKITVPFRVKKITVDYFVFFSENDGPEQITYINLMSDILQDFGSEYNNDKLRIIAQVDDHEKLYCKNIVGCDYSQKNRRRASIDGVYTFELQDHKGNSIDASALNFQILLEVSYYSSE